MSHVLEDECIALTCYLHMQEHNKSELERFDEERQWDFMNMLHGFVQTQVVLSNPFAFYGPSIFYSQM